MLLLFGCFVRFDAKRNWCRRSDVAENPPDTHCCGPLRVIVNLAVMSKETSVEAKKALDSAQKGSHGYSNEGRRCEKLCGRPSEAGQSFRRIQLLRER